MSQELQQNRYDQLIRRVGGLIGGGSKVSEVLGELFPVLDVENVPGELLWLGGTRLCVGASSRTGAAGEASRIQVFNPLESGMLITITSVMVTTATAQTIRMAISNVALTTGVGTELFRDSRGRPILRPTGSMRTDSLAALADANWLFRMDAQGPNVFSDVNGLAVLTPGFGFEVGANTVATDLIITFLWRERVAELSELNL